MAVAKYYFSPEELDTIRERAPIVEVHGDKVLRFFSRAPPAEFKRDFASPWLGIPKAKKARILGAYVIVR